ncbi:MAG TPA: DNA/RNA non-specific endonuclease [Pyrinomonadaceae bacterium]|nr:DNA/RNA non-specific endonuclease [Pyrinomonadaceae bacterium]
MSLRYARFQSGVEQRPLPQRSASRGTIVTRLKLLLIASIICLSGFASAQAQSVVVNKYFNSGTTADIVELLVIQNNVDMRGMFIKDFSSNMANDGGGKYQFSNDALWSSLPSGTLIVLRNNNSAADVTVGSGDFNLDVGMQNTTYFTNAGGTFDIATTEMVMIKTAASGAAGVTGSIHALAGGTAGAQFTAAASPKLRATGTSGTNQFVFANSSTQSLADFDGTDATGAATGLTFGAGNNANNTTYINSLRNPGPATEPTVQAANVVFSSISASSLTVSWTNGNGQSRLVLARQGSAVDGEPVDFTSYTANANFGSGSQINGGNYVVFAGTGNSVIVTGLLASTTYHFAVFEFNGASTSTNYLTTNPALGNQQTAAAFQISGRVKTQSNAGLSGIGLTLSSDDTPLANTVTDANGNYTFQNVTAGADYTIAPSTNSFTFAPSSISFIALSGNQAGADFVGTPRVIISEFRLHGIDPDGGGPLTASSNEFIELYNQSTENVTVTGWTLRASTGATLITFPATAIPARGHFLIGGTGYGLSMYAAPDLTLGVDVPDGAGLALFNSSTTFDLSTRLDAVGFSGVADSVYREGSGLTPSVGITTDGEVSFVRQMPSGNSIDSDDNQTDFLLVSTDGGIYNSRQSTLGAPGPENSTSPVDTNSLTLGLLDLSKPAVASPNRVRTGNVGTSPNGAATDTISIRRTIVNNTGANITKLRFRIVDLSTLPAAPGAADLRAFSSGNIIVTVGAGNRTVQGTTLEQPPTQGQGGGLNSTLVVSAITPANPLANGASVDLQFVLGVQTDGAVRFLVKTEATTQAPATANEHLTMGNPSNATTDVNQPANYLMEKAQYAVSYNRDRGIPNWVSWHVDPSWLGTAPRQNDYRADTTLPAGWYQVQNTDYSGSGFDRGHHCPSADRTLTVADNSATFLMTNMMPQAPNNNQGPWNNLEAYCRTLVGQGNEVYIITGGSGQGGTGSNGGVTMTVASGHVVVPSQTWKVIIVIPQGTNDVSRVTTSTRTIAVIMPNAQGLNSDWHTWRVSVDQVEALTGFDFFSNVPVGIQAVIEASVDNQP